MDSHLGYALSQIKKARGTNKRVWNPWPEKPPQAEDYCLFLGDAKGRAVPVREAEVNLANCKVTRLVGNRAADMFALYDYGAPTGGIFHGGLLVETGAADIDREKRIGILIYNEQAFNSAKRQHHEYWDWRRNRNESRWTAQERGQMDEISILVGDDQKSVGTHLACVPRACVATGRDPPEMRCVSF